MIVYPSVTTTFEDLNTATESLPKPLQRRGCSLTEANKRGSLLEPHPASPKGRRA
ncbi:hypothetical protein HMPREF0973_01239 [Prevotella veroralis F0319]|uniref:Uncharacterized protein n=1 Tax=Prevotella veroralis F0319 TaxID=649761 RepID=C9MNQ0_9BACT|nr:hypothetical protein HMPREF0973_01239 [Prevotella veroralis F0319]